ncbi:hypothetical protein V6N13_149398 [Hibiscus sabdariffa]
MTGFSQWDFPIPNHSNLQCFLKCTTPTLTKRSKTCTGEAKEVKGGFRLNELWQCFTEWSAYGVGVPILLNNGGRVIQYYSPSLSALQLYTIKPISSSTASGHQIGDNFRYPVYQVPGATNVKELSACFLTYHPLSSLSLGSKKVEDKRSSMATVEEICIPPFAMATYKMFGKLWENPETSDSDFVLCQQKAASYWLKLLQFHHHDFNFFMSRQF